MGKKAGNDWNYDEQDNQREATIEKKEGIGHLVSRRHLLYGVVGSILGGLSVLTVPGLLKGNESEEPIRVKQPIPEQKQISPKEIESQSSPIFRAELVEEGTNSDRGVLFAIWKVRLYNRGPVIRQPLIAFSISTIEPEFCLTSGIQFSPWDSTTNSTMTRPNDIPEDSSILLEFRIDADSLDSLKRRQTISSYSINIATQIELPPKLIANVPVKEFALKEDLRNQCIRSLSLNGSPIVLVVEGEPLAQRNEPIKGLEFKIAGKKGEWGPNNTIVFWEHFRPHEILRLEALILTDPNGTELVTPTVIETSERLLGETTLPNQGYSKNRSCTYQLGQREITDRRCEDLKAIPVWYLGFSRKRGFYLIGSE